MQAQSFKCVIRGHSNNTWHFRDTFDEHDDDERDDDERDDDDKQPDVDFLYISTKNDHINNVDEI